MATCETCRWWSEDDETDETGISTCVALLNDGSVRAWRTRRGYWCKHFLGFKPKEAGDGVA